MTGYKESIKALNIGIAKLKEVIPNAPDPVELAEVLIMYLKPDTTEYLHLPKNIIWSLSVRAGNCI
jgi:hypothetical protein